MNFIVNLLFNIKVDFNENYILNRSIMKRLLKQVAQKQTKKFGKIILIKFSIRIKWFINLGDKKHK